MAEDDQSTSSTGDGREAGEQQPAPSAGGRPWKGWQLVQQLALPLIGLAVGIGVVATVVDGDGAGEGGGAPAPSQRDDSGAICSDALERVRQVPQDPANPVPALVEAEGIALLAAERLEEAGEPRLAATFTEEAAALGELAATYEADDRTLYRRARARLREAGRTAQSAARSAGAPECVRLARLLRRPVR